MIYRIRVKDRALEWHVAAFTAFFGIWIGAPDTSFGAPHLQAAINLMPEGIWATLFAGIGILHLVALGINGSAWWTPIARAAAAAINLFFFAVLAAEIWEVDHGAAAVAVYFGMVVSSLVTVLFKALRDCFLLRRAWDVERT